MKNNPKETQLASKIGQALVKTHNYGKVHENACFICHNICVWSLPLSYNIKGLANIEKVDLLLIFQDIINSINEILALSLIIFFIWRQ